VIQEAPRDPYRALGPLLDDPRRHRARCRRAVAPSMYCPMILN
jgi:hypothetical protein